VLIVVPLSLRPVAEPDFALQNSHAAAMIRGKVWPRRSLIIQVKCGSFARRTLCQPSLLDEKGKAMRKSLMALAAVATLAVSAVTPAHAQRGFGVGLAAGVVGGAIVGGALASPYYYGPGYYPGYYGPGYGYGRPAYVAADPYAYGGCVWQRQRFWDGYGWRFRRVRICG
jgi:hypothetical protein